MARVGKLFIAGAEEFDGKYRCGISYSLSITPPVSYIYEMNQGIWQVEFTAESNDVVARTIEDVSYEELQSNGFSAIQEALDILSVKGIFSSNLWNPGKSNIGVYYKNGKRVLFTYSLFDYPMGTDLEIRQVDIHGNEVVLSTLQEPVWNESFRYYRISQSSNDLFEAYRNLFLAFEALLNSICQKERSEGEGTWLQRSLSMINARVSLSQFTPTGNEDPVAYIKRSQYEHIRCHLQHAKFPNAVLPHSNLNPIDVQNAYVELLQIWRKIASSYFHTQTGGGVITNAGFSHMMNNLFMDKAIIYYTPDQSPSRNEDIAVSPLGVAVYKFHSSNYLGQVFPGVVRITAYEDIATLSEQFVSPVYRICCGIPESLFGVNFIKSGLTVSGVDSWECTHDIRLINSSQPKMVFET